MTTLTIGQLARAAGVAARTIRYYEQVGVLPAPRRTPAGYRAYGADAVEPLRFIRRARALGLPVRHLGALSAALRNGAGPSVRARLLPLVRAQAAAVRARIEDLEVVQEQLEQALRRLRQPAPRMRGARCRCLDAGRRDTG